MVICPKCKKKRAKNPCEHCGSNLTTTTLSASGDDGTGKPKETHTDS